MFSQISDHEHAWELIMDIISSDFDHEMYNSLIIHFIKDMHI